MSLLKFGFGTKSKVDNKAKDQEEMKIDNKNSPVKRRARKRLVDSDEDIPSPAAPRRSPRIKRQKMDNFPKDLIGEEVKPKPIKSLNIAAINTSKPEKLIKHVYASGTTFNETESWVEKYKPKKISDLIGNNSAINNLKNWLNNWHNVHISKTVKVPFNKQNPGAKCALISGPPGIGKTSAAHLVAKTLGFEVFETNASDARSKKLIREKLSDSVNNTTILLSSMKLSSPRTVNNNHNKSVNKTKVIIMDEVDGMSSDDRGGMQELIKLLKTSKIPVICICNDRMKSSVRSLANHAYDLRFSRPNKITIHKRLTEIASRENLQLDKEALEMIIQSSSGDVRQLLNALEMMALEGKASNRNSGMFSSEWAKSKSWTMKKDSVLSVDHNQAVQFIYNQSQKKESFKLRFDAFFVNYDLIPLLVAENYPSAVRNYSKRNSSSNMNDNSLQSLKMFSECADASSDSDIISTQIMRNQRWSLLPLNAALNLRIAHCAKGGIGFAGFPEYLGKFSSIRRKRKLLDEMNVHMRQFTNGQGSKSIRLDMLDVLKKTIMSPLKTNGKAGVAEALDFMDSYGMSRDDVFETLQEITFSDPALLIADFEKLDPKIKREFTRLYNTGSHRSQQLAREDAIIGLKKPKRKMRVKEDDEEIEGDEQEDDGMRELMEKKQKQKKKKPLKKSRLKK